MHSQFIPIDRRNEGAIVGNAVKVFRDGFVTDAPDGASWYEKWLNSAGTRVFPTIDPVTRGGNAAGSAYLRITLDPSARK